jgi:hypothetical protein
MQEFENRLSQLGIGSSEKPKVSVLLTSVGDVARLAECLEDCLAQCSATESQVIVLRAGDAEDVADLMTRYPSVVFLAMSASTTVAELRREGVRTAEGDIIVVQSADLPSREFFPHRLFISPDAE